MSAAPARSNPMPPWPYTAAALLAFSAYFVGNGPTLVMPLLALCLLAVYVVPVRVERATSAAWLTRLVLYAVVAALNWGHEPQLMDAWMSAAGMNFLGPILAAELVLRAYHRSANTRQMLLLSGLVLLFGCATSDERVGLFLVPPYFLSVIFALRADRVRVAEPARSAPMLLRIGMVILAFAVGGVAHWSFRAYQSQIVAWRSEVLGDQPRPASAAETSGIDKDPTLGPTFGSPGSSTRILRVLGSLSDPHLHGMAFDTYTRGSWLPTLGMRHFDTASPADLKASASGPRVQITRFVNDDGMICAPLSCSGIAFRPNFMPLWAAQDGGPLRRDTIDALTYQVILGATDTYQGPFCTALTPQERTNCLAVPPEIDPRVRALAQRIAGDVPTPLGKAEAVEGYLLQNNAYSLRTDPGRGDPVSNFLLGHKAAHCEFFASSATILLRCVGVPTRYVIGYYAHESDGPGVTVVRGQDAHAWAESWIDGTGWVVVEATPGNGRPDRTAKTPFWWKWRDRWQDLTLAIRAWVARLTGVRLIALLVGLIVVLLIPTVFRAWRALRVPTTPVFAYAAPPPALAELAARFDAWLVHQGVPCPPDRPWQEHIGVGLSLDLAQAFLTAYNRARFGAEDDPAARVQAAEALARLENGT